MIVKIIIFIFGLCYLARIGLRYMKYLNGPADHASVKEEAGKEKRFRKILGVQTNSSEEEIKKAYRKRIAEYHPDKVQNMAPEIRSLAEERTAELTEAYAYLKQKQDPK